MAETLKRSELQSLAEAKLIDVQILLEAKRYGSSFYLAGYVIEFGLKACIAKRMVAQAIPDKKFINELHTHDLKKLVNLAGLQTELRDEQKANELFATYWGISGTWNEASRYAATDAYTSHLMVDAVQHPESGIFRWIKQHW